LREEEGNFLFCLEKQEAVVFNIFKGSGAKPKFVHGPFGYFWFCVTKLNSPYLQYNKIFSKK